MFLESSRYHKLRQEETTTQDGRVVKVVTLRRLPYVEGAPALIKANDELDVMAQRQYDDATRFWHIADANTELEAGELMQTGRTIKVPES